MTVKELKETLSKDTRSLEELVNTLIERKAISPSIARKYFEVQLSNETVRTRL